MSDKLLTKISALLRKAEKTDNPHEADAYLKAAQRLATQSSIDLAVARAHVHGKANRTSPVHRRIAIGEVGKRGLKTYGALFLAVAAANDIKCDIARNSSFIVAFGYVEDIEVVQALYSSLVVQMVAASDAYLRTGAHKREIVFSERRREYVRVSGSAARINFQSAFAARIARRLQEAKADAQQEAANHTPGSALALRNKEVEIVDYYASTSTARGTWKSRSSAAYSRSAREAGDRAGCEARIGISPDLPGIRKQVSA